MYSARPSSLAVLDELRHRHLLQLGDVDLAALDLLVAVVDRRVAEDVLVLDVGELLAGHLAVADSRAEHRGGRSGRGGGG